MIGEHQSMMNVVGVGLSQNGVIYQNFLGRNG